MGFKAKARKHEKDDGVDTDKASKKTAKTRYHVVARIDDGKISYLWHYYDPVPFLQHAGYTVTPPKQ